MKLPFKIKEIKPSIFLFEFTNQYDMCMHFLRYQEYYESPNPKFRNKSFTILEFMKWQAETEGNGNFTYPTKWSGFNFPQHIVVDLHEKGIVDINNYDINIKDAWYKCGTIVDGCYQDFYIIGCLKGNDKTLNHEIAHGTFYLNPEYKKEATKLVKALPAKVRANAEKVLVSFGYTKHVFIDEINAFFSTSPKEELAAYGFKIKNHDKAFKDLFNKVIK